MLPVLLMYIRKMVRTVTFIGFMFYAISYIVRISYGICLMFYVLWYKCIYDMLETT
ncbi:hypothetical protein J14TS5_24030 [Paenibacillus lautus]|nr:hypothetical protein J14TS5_24030 [Paenibacillus lautus]